MPNSLLPREGRGGCGVLLGSVPSLHEHPVGEGAEWGWDGLWEQVGLPGMLTGLRDPPLPEPQSQALLSHPSSMAKWL